MMLRRPIAADYGCVAPGVVACLFHARGVNFNESRMRRK